VGWSAWWQNLNHIRRGWRVTWRSDCWIIQIERWMMRHLLCFGRIHGLMVPLFVSFRRLFELTDNELIIVADMYLLRWGVNGEA